MTSMGERWARLHELEALRRGMEAEMARLVADAVRDGDGEADGHGSVRGRLRAELRWSDADASAMVRLAGLVGDVPEVIDALEAGRIGIAQARAFGRARANPRCGERLAEHADGLLEHARVLSFHGFALCIRRWEQLADLDGAHRSAEAAHARRGCSLLPVGDGVVLSGRGGALEGAELIEILDRFADAEFQADWDEARRIHGDAATVGRLARTAGQRRWDALVRIFRAAASTPPGAQAPEPTLNLVMDVATFEAIAAGASGVEVPWELRRCETTNGLVVDPVAAVAAGLVGHVRRVVVDAAGTVIDLGRRRRLFTGAAREAAMLQSATCVWPGCERPARSCQVDHHQEWHAAGATSAANGGPMCAAHNREKHRRHHRVWRDPGGVWHTYRPDGTEVAPPPPPASAPTRRWHVELDCARSRSRLSPRPARRPAVAGPRTG